MTFVDLLILTGIFFSTFFCYQLFSGRERRKYREERKQFSFFRDFVLHVVGASLLFSLLHACLLWVIPGDEIVFKSWLILTIIFFFYRLHVFTRHIPTNYREIQILFYSIIEFFKDVVAPTAVVSLVFTFILTIGFPSSEFAHTVTELPKLIKWSDSHPRLPEG